MKNEKLINILQAAIIIVFGIILAVAGPSAALDTWFGIGFLVGGIALLVLAIYGGITTKVFSLGTLAGGTILTTIGIVLFTEYLSLGVILGFLVFALLGLGIGLLIHGIFVIFFNKLIAGGLVEIIVGALTILFSILYITVPDFQQAFWIIMGVLIAIYGALALVLSIFSKGDVVKK